MSFLTYMSSLFFHSLLYLLVSFLLLPTALGDLEQQGLGLIDSGLLPEQAYICFIKLLSHYESMGFRQYYSTVAFHWNRWGGVSPGSLEELYSALFLFCRCTHARSLSI